MSLRTRPVHKTLACEIEGLRLWEPLDSGTVAELQALWSSWGVLVFRRQALSEAELQPGDIVIRDGAPPQPAPAPAGHFLNRAL